MQRQYKSQLHNYAQKKNLDTPPYFSTREGPVQQDKLFCMTHEAMRRARAEKELVEEAEETRQELREKEEALKIAKENLSKANEQVRSLRAALAAAETKLQTQKDQFLEQLAKAVSDTQTQAVQDFLQSAKFKERMAAALGTVCRSYQAEICPKCVW